MRIVESYFRAEPYVEQGGLDYVGNPEYSANTFNYWFFHVLSSIQMSLVNNGFAIEHFSEYETAISPNHRHIEEAGAGIPLSYFLIGRKKNSS